jgi:predicted DNA-binding protein (UPF0251 family)
MGGTAGAFDREGLPMRDKSLSVLALLVLDHFLLGLTLNETAERLGVDRETVLRAINEIEQSH